ncbi:hypothetical protein QP162_12410 [Sphingomonas aurantiaca]|uniref:hypothetical protein n=1 Tax=Sphingomonas aurantiaca TaxID=185949 RepID=UPI002FE14363
MTRPHAEPRDVFHENGEVIIDGPNGTVIAMTPEAALRTAGRLDEAALDEADRTCADRRQDAASP